MAVFLFNATVTIAIYTLSLHDALPISKDVIAMTRWGNGSLVSSVFSNDPSFLQEIVLGIGDLHGRIVAVDSSVRSEEHTSELQLRVDLVCRLLLEKKKKKIIN